MIYILIFFFMSAVPSFSQEVSTGSLLDDLTQLKQQSDKLVIYNQQLERETKGLREKVTQLQLAIGQEQMRQQDMADSLEKWKEQNPKLTPTINKRQDEVFLQTDTLGKKEQEKKALETQLQDVNKALMVKDDAVTDAAPAITIEEEERQKEKIRLLRMLDVSMQRQLDLQDDILEQTAHATPIMVSQANLIAQKEVLLKQIEQRRQQLTAIKAQADQGPRVTAQEMTQLQEQLSNLEHNYAQMKELWSKVRDKNTGFYLSPPQQVERNKLKYNIDALDRESKKLSYQLSQLRIQMVDLDKRKYKLESSLRKAR